MAVKVGTAGTTVKKVAIAGSNTVVKKVTVGTPVRKVTAGAFTIDRLGGVDFTELQNGSLLIYDELSGEWKATNDLENQTINGGSY